MYYLIKTAAQLRGMLVYLKYDDVGLIENELGHAGDAGEVEISVPVHGTHGHHGNVHMYKLAVVPAEIAEYHGREKTQTPVAQLTLIAGAVPGVVNKMLLAGVAFHGLYGPEHQVALHPHTAQLVTAL